MVVSDFISQVDACATATSCGCKGSHIAGFSKTNKKSYAPNLQLEPKHIEVYLDIDLENRTVRSKVITHVFANQPARSLSLDGVNFSEVSALDVSDDQSNTLSYRYDGKQIHVTWEHPLRKGETRKVQTTYVVSDPVSGIVFGNNTRLGQYAAIDNESERARYWLACVDYPAVRTTFDFYLTVNKDHLAFANGLLQGETINGDRKTSHWHLDHVCPSYLVCWAVGDLIQVDDREVHGIAIKYIAPRGAKENELKSTFDKTPVIIEWLEKRLNVPFPFKKYYQFIAPHMGGAMENISLVTFDWVFLLDETLEKEFKLLVDTINLHEATHSYFGDLVVIRHFEHAWMKESWATYMEAVWTKDFYGLDEHRYELYNQAERYMDECETYMRPIVCRQYDSSWDMFDSHTYPGGSWRIHMLRHKIGEENFWNAVSDYLRSYGTKTAETEDFRKTLEKHSGLNLTKFFDQWFYGKGFPKLKGDVKYDSEKKTLQLTFEQTQAQNDKTVEVFDLEIEVLVVFTPASEGAAPETALTTVKFEDGTTRATTIVLAPSKPHTIRVDPEQKVLFSLKEFDYGGEDVLNNTMRDVAGGDIINRIRAAQELVKVGSKQALDKVRDAMKEEPFYGVRIKAAQALSKSKSYHSIRSLCALLSEETDPRAHFWIANYCMSVRDEEIKQALLKFLQRENLTYRAHGKALEAFGAQRFNSEQELEDAYRLILSHIDADTRYSTAFVRCGGYRALGNLHYRPAYDTLKERLVTELRDSRHECRVAIVDGIAEYAHDLDATAHGRKDAVRLLVDNLSDRDERIRRAIISGLVKLGATTAKSAIASIRPTFAHQYHPWFDRKMEALAKGDATTAEVKKLEKELDDLRGLVKKLSEKVDTLAAAAVAPTPTPATTTTSTTTTTTTTPTPSTATSSAQFK